VPKRKQEEKVGKKMLHNLYSLPDIEKMFESRSMRIDGDEYARIQNFSRKT
jgi:hypothetical protein